MEAHCSALGSRMESLAHSRLRKRFRANVSMYEVVGLPGFEQMFSQLETNAHLVQTRRALMPAIVACTAHWKRVLAHSASEEEEREAWECAGEYAGGSAFFQYELCRGRSNVSRCEEDYSLMRNHIVHEAVLEAEWTPELRKASNRCGDLDRDSLSGAVGYGAWVECMAPVVCPEQTLVAVECLEQSSSATCGKQVLDMFACAMHRGDTIYALQVSQKLKHLTE